MWAKLIAAVLAVALLVAVLVVLGRLILSALHVADGGGETTVDPQFREAAETVTRPPEPDEGVGLGREDTDPSASWTMEEEGPVDQTAEELAEEGDAGTEEETSDPSEAAEAEGGQ